MKCLRIFFKGLSNFTKREKNISIKKPENKYKELEQLYSLFLVGGVFATPIKNSVFFNQDKNLLGFFNKRYKV